MTLYPVIACCSSIEYCMKFQLINWGMKYLVTISKKWKNKSHKLLCQKTHNSAVRCNRSLLLLPSAAFTPFHFKPSSWQRFTSDQNNSAISYLRSRGFVFSCFCILLSQWALIACQNFPTHWEKKGLDSLKIPRSKTWSCLHLELVFVDSVKCYITVVRELHV